MGPHFDRARLGFCVDRRLRFDLVATDEKDDPADDVDGNRGGGTEVCTLTLGEDLRAGDDREVECAVNDRGRDLQRTTVASPAPAFGNVP